MKISEHKISVFVILFLGVIFGILIRRPVEGALWAIATALSYRSDELFGLLKGLNKQKIQVDGIRKKLGLGNSF